MIRFKWLLFFCVGLYSITTKAQTYNIATQNGNTGVDAIYTCSGTFTDSNAGTGTGGYCNGCYINNEDYSVTFCPSTAGDVVRLTFTQFCVQISGGSPAARTCEDWLYVYQGNVDPASATPDDVYCGVLTGANLPVITSSSPDGCITFRFQSTNDNKVDCGWSANISCLTPCRNPTALLDDITPLELCPSTADNPGSLTVSFDATGSSSGNYILPTSHDVVNYDWEWGDGSFESTTLGTNTHTYSSEGIYVMKLRVRDDNTDFSATGCQSSNSMTRIIKVLPEPEFTGTTDSPVEISCGENVTLTAVTTSQTRTQSLPSVATGTIALPDGNGDSYISGANYSGLFPDGSTVTSGCYPTVCFDLEHSWATDLTIDLIAPNGQTVRLYNRNRPSADKYMFGACVRAADDGLPGCPREYCVANTGTLSWTSTASRTTTTQTCALNGTCETGYSFIAGTYTSAEPFSNLNGAPLNGIWTIRITDNQSLDDGTLFGWSLSFPSGCYVDLETVTPDIVSTTWSHSGTGPGVPAQTSSSTGVVDPGPDACPTVGICTGTEITNSIVLGPFNTAGSYVYDFESEDEFGCLYTRSVSVEVDDCSCPITGSAGSDDEVCLNESYQLNGSHTAATTFSWTTNPAGAVGDLDDPNILDPVFTPTQDYGGLVVFTLALSDGSCTVTRTVEITVNTLPVVDAGDLIEFCAGQTTTLTVTGASTYFWDNGLGAGGSHDVSPAITTIYSVTGTDANGCENTDNVTVTPISNITISENVTNASCIGGSDGAISLTITGGVGTFDFIWSNTETTQNITGLIAGVYGVTVDDNVCNSEASYTITEPTAITITAVTSDLTCNGDNSGEIDLTVTGGSGTYTYLWSNSSTTQDLSGLSANNYSVTVNDGSCTETASYTITQPSAITVNGTPTNLTCNGDNSGEIDLTVTGGSGTYTYLWSNSSTTQDLSGLSANNYSVTVNDGSCIETASYTITQPSAITVSDATNNLSCNGDNSGSIDLTVTGGSGSYTYLWSTTSTTQDISGLSANTYSVTVNDGSCIETASYTITQPSVITVSTSTTLASCGGSDGTATATPSGGTGAFTYLWSSDAQTTQTATGLAAAVYTVSVYDANLCLRTANANVNNPSGTINLVSNISVTCYGGSDGSLDIDVVGGSTPYSFTWSTTPTQTNSTGTATGLSAGSYNVTVEDNANCFSFADYTILEPSEITLSTLSIQNPSCFGDANGQISIVASGGTSGYIYEWNNGETTNIISSLSGGVYDVTVTDAASCENTFSISLTTPERLETRLLNLDNVLCFGGSDGFISLETSGGSTPYTYLWSNGETSSSTSNLTEGTYSVSVEDAGSCQTLFREYPSSCFKITKILVDACGPQEGEEEMFFFLTGPDPLNTADISISWPNTSNPWLGVCTNPTFVTNTNATITGGGYLVEPTGGVIPPNSSVLFVTSQAPNTSSMSFVDLNDTIYVVFQCVGNTSGHFANHGTGIRTLTMSFGAGCEDVVSYDRALLTRQDGTIGGQDGGSVAYDFEGNATYYNIGCVAPFDVLPLTNTFDYTITQPTQLNVSLTESHVSCNGWSDGEITTNVSGGISPYTYSWSNGSTTNMISGLVAAVYTVTVQDNNLCEYMESITITEPSLLTITSETITDVVCNGDNTGQIDNNSDLEE
jgi:subtilisin-like proprotein convertase family protein/predicted TIM-barrel enzyme